MDFFDVNNHENFAVDNLSGPILHPFDFEDKSDDSDDKPPIGVGLNVLTEASRASGDYLVCRGDDPFIYLPGLEDWEASCLVIEVMGLSHHLAERQCQHN